MTRVKNIEEKISTNNKKKYYVQETIASLFDT